MSRSREKKRALLMKWAKAHDSRGGAQHMLDLDDRYPTVGMFDEQCISAEVGAGWANLLEPVLEVLARHGCKAGQIKAKFCELVVHWDGPEWTERARKTWWESGRPGPDPMDLFKEVDMVIRLMAHRSLYACERCGQRANRIGTPCDGIRHCDECENVDPIKDR
jgi:hypothetical protein